MFTKVMNGTMIENRHLNSMLGISANQKLMMKDPDREISRKRLTAKLPHLSPRCPFLSSSLPLTWLVAQTAS